MSHVHAERPEKLFPGSTLLSERHQVSTYPKTNEKCCIRTEPDERWSESVSECISYTGLFMWIWKISTFSPDLAVTWGVLSKWHFSLCPSECMLYECVTMNSLCIFTWKKNCPRISKSMQTPSPTEFVCNQLDMALTSMYTKVLKWDDTECSTKCWNMSQYSLPPVIIHFVCIIYHPVQSFSVFSCEKPEEAPSLQTGFAWTQM